MSEPHVITLDGPDVSGHYEYECPCGENATGYEAQEILAEAEKHAPLAAGQQQILDRIAADIADGD